MLVTSSLETYLLEPIGQIPPWSHCAWAMGWGRKPWRYFGLLLHEELRRLLDVVAATDHPRCRIDPDTYRTLLLLLYGAGLRISEALALTLADVDLDSGILCIRESKFYKTRLVPIGAI